MRDQQAAGRPVRYKVLLDGSPACGKTCLRKSMQGKPFDPHYVSLWRTDGLMVPYEYPSDHPGNIPDFLNRSYGNVSTWEGYAPFPRPHRTIWVEAEDEVGGDDGDGGVVLSCGAMCVCAGGDHGRGLLPRACGAGGKGDGGAAGE
jgi:hypothetical protein